MGETYDSIGSRVIRHFRHYITGNRHMWLKGDYLDPTMQSGQLPHTGEIQRVSVEIPSTTVSQEISSPHRETATSEALPLPSAEKRGEEPEEQETPIEKEQTTEEKMDVADSTKVQKDSGVLNGRVKHAAKHPAPTDVHTVEFSFQTTEIKGAHMEERSDETDLLLVKDDDIIDVRPFIEANRAKHVKLSGNERFENYIDTKLKIDNCVLQNGMDESSFTDIDDHHVQVVLEKQVETFLSQRSVYYRSQHT